MAIDLNRREQIAEATSKGLAAFSATASQTRALIGFDGFVDSIIAVVDKRSSLHDYTPLATIADFGQRISAAAGQSSNFELVTKIEKLGGNGPIMANALASGGVTTDYLGALGSPAVHAAFAALEERATLYSVEEPGYTDALEFDDGKLMLGKYEHLARLSGDAIIDALGQETFTKLVAEAKLIGMVNWTMMTEAETIWEKVAEVLAAVEARPLIFIDLADPAKRTDEDILRALKHAGRIQSHAEVVLGLNLSEAVQVARVLGLPEEPDAEAAILKLATGIRSAIGIHGCVVHPRRGAAAALADGSSAQFAGPFVEKPKLSTGAGDNFNAGFCLGLLAGLPIDEALCCGTATSGFYVREARSPKLDELITFCGDLPAPQA